MMGFFVVTGLLECNFKKNTVLIHFTHFVRISDDKMSDVVFVEIALS